MTNGNTNASVKTETESKTNLRQELDTTERIHTKFQQISNVLTSNPESNLTWWELCQITNPNNPEESAERLIQHIDDFFAELDINEDIYNMLVKNSKITPADLLGLCHVINGIEGGYFDYE